MYFLLLLADVDVFHGLAVQIVDLQRISRHKSFEVGRSQAMATLVGLTEEMVLVSEARKLLPFATGTKKIFSASL
jgi:hypothetical protein